MIYIILFLHFVGLPLAVLAAVMAGLYSIAIIDGIAFLVCFGVWASLWKK